MKKLIILFLLLFTIGCSKKSINTSEFKSIVRDNGYYVISIKDQFKEYNYITEALLARKDNVNIEFYVMIDDENAKAFYDLNKEVMDAYRTSDSMYKDKQNKYVLSTDERYMVISLIDNTCIYVDTEITNKAKVNSILKKLGY